MDTRSGVDILEMFIRNYMRKVHTIKPARVTSVNDDNTLNAEILTRTRMQEGRISDFPEVQNVPYMILSGQSGMARITFDIAVGDNVVILFSDRDYAGLLDDGSTVETPQSIYTHEFFPLMALPCFFTTPNAKPVEKQKIVIENTATKISVSATGEVEIVAPTTTTITTPMMVVNSPMTRFNGIISMQGMVPLPGATGTSIEGDLQMTGELDVTGEVVVNGVNHSIHRHAPSTVPPTNP